MQKLSVTIKELEIEVNSLLSKFGNTSFAKVSNAMATNTLSESARALVPREGKWGNARRARTPRKNILIKRVSGVLCFGVWF